MFTKAYETSLKLELLNILFEENYWELRIGEIKKLCLAEHIIVNFFKKNYTN